VNGGATANPAINALVQVAGVFRPEVPIAQFCNGGTIPAGAFTHCAVPLSALQAANVTFERFALKEARGLTLPTVYFDQIAIVPGGTVTPPPPAIQSFTASAASIVASESVWRSPTAPARARRGP
jgi:chitinase